MTSIANLFNLSDEDINKILVDSFGDILDKDNIPFTENSKERKIILIKLYYRYGWLIKEDQKYLENPLFKDILLLANTLENGLEVLNDLDFLELMSICLIYNNIKPAYWEHMKVKLILKTFPELKVIRVHGVSLLYHEDNQHMIDNYIIGKSDSEIDLGYVLGYPTPGDHAKPWSQHKYGYGLSINNVAITGFISLQEIDYETFILPYINFLEKTGEECKIKFTIQRYYWDKMVKLDDKITLYENIINRKKRWVDII